jgi:hypothetical protein
MEVLMEVKLTTPKRPKMHSNVRRAVSLKNVASRGPSLPIVLIVSEETLPRKKGRMELLPLAELAPHLFLILLEIAVWLVQAMGRVQPAQVWISKM